MNLSLVRVSSQEFGTFGVLRTETHVPFAVTLELPWKHNEAWVSCIPPGRYVCKRVKSPQFGETFEVTGVSGRSHILFHAGNTMADTAGCILVAEEFGGTDLEPIIANSKRGYGEFMAKQAGVDEFELEILDLGTR
jgi:hypothetical protein